MVHNIYRSELRLIKANNSDLVVSFLDLHLSVVNGKIISKIYDKREDFNFEIVNFPHLDGDIPELHLTESMSLNLFVSLDAVLKLRILICVIFL